MTTTTTTPATTTTTTAAAAGGDDILSQDCVHRRRECHVGIRQHRRTTAAPRQPPGAVCKAPTHDSLISIDTYMHTHSAIRMSSPERTDPGSGRPGLEQPRPRGQGGGSSRLRSGSAVAHRRRHTSARLAGRPARRYAAARVEAAACRVARLSLIRSFDRSGVGPGARSHFSRQKKNQNKTKKTKNPNPPTPTFRLLACAGDAVEQLDHDLYRNLVLDGLVCSGRAIAVTRAEDALRDKDGARRGERLGRKERRLLRKMAEQAALLQQQSSAGRAADDALLLKEAEAAGNAWIVSRHVLPSRRRRRGTPHLSVCLPFGPPRSSCFRSPMTTFATTGASGGGVGRAAWDGSTIGALHFPLKWAARPILRFGSGRRRRGSTFCGQCDDDTVLYSSTLLYSTLSLSLSFLALVSVISSQLQKTRTKKAGMHS